MWLPLQRNRQKKLKKYLISLDISRSQKREIAVQHAYHLNHKLASIITKRTNTKSPSNRIPVHIASVRTGTQYAQCKTVPLSCAPTLSHNQVNVVPNAKVNNATIRKPKSTTKKVSCLDLMFE